MKRMFFALVLILGLVLSACGPAPTPAPTQDLSAVETQAVASAYADLTAAAPTPIPPPPGPTPDPALPVAVVPAAVSGQPAGIANYNTAIMSGPGTNYVLYSVLLGGTTVQVTGKSQDGQWWVIRLNPQNVGVGYGWVNAPYVQTANTENVQTIQNPETYTTAAPVPPTSSGAPSATTTDYVNVRSGPGTNYPVLVVAPPATTGEVTGKSADGGWYQVKVPTQYSSTGLGWVSASYVVPQNTSSVPVVEAPPAPAVPAARSSKERAHISEPRTLARGA